MAPLQTDNSMISDTSRMSSASSNVLRKSEPHTAGNMIASFADRRSMERSRPNEARKSEFRASTGSSTWLSRGQISRKLKSISPLPAEPRAVSEGQIDKLSNLREHSRRERGVKNGSMARRSFRRDLIVDFPVSSRRSHFHATRQETIGSGGMLRSSLSKQEPDMSYGPSRDRQGNHSRHFEDVVDWANTSIVWGDEDEESIDVDAMHEKCIRPEPQARRVGKRPGLGNKELSESSRSLLSGLEDFSQSLTSLLSIREVDFS